MNLKKIRTNSGRESHSCSRCSSWCSASSVLRAWRPQLRRGKHPMRCRILLPTGTTGRPSTRCSTTVATTHPPVARSENPTGTTTGPTSISCTARTTTAMPTSPPGQQPDVRPGRPVTHAQRHFGRQLRDVAREHNARDTLYIPVPLFTNPPPTQCMAPRPASTTHRRSTLTDCRRLPGNPSPASVSNIPIPAHNHVVGTRNSGSARMVECPGGRHDRPCDVQHLDQRQRHQCRGDGGTAITVPTNAFLFFQILPGTLSASMAANLTATAPPGPALPIAPGAPRRARWSRERPSTI